MNGLQLFGLTVAVQITIIAAISLALIWMFRKRASWVASIGQWGLCFALFSPAALLFLPQNDWLMLQAESAPVTDITSNEPMIMGQIIFDHMHTDALPGDADQPLITGSILFPQPAEGSSSPAVDRLPETPADVPVTNLMNWLPPILTLLGLIWIAGILWCSYRLWKSYRIIGKIRESLEPVNALLADVDRFEISSLLKLKQTPEIYQSNLVPVPLIIGVRNPMIVFPETTLSNCHSGQIRSVLLHEMAHLKRYDHWMLLLQQTITLLYWWHPGIHAMSAAVTRYREEVCDNYVLKHVTPADYAETLLQFATQNPNNTIPALTVGMLSRQWKLEERICGLLSPRRRAETQTAPVLLGGLCTLLGAAIIWLGGVCAEPAIDKLTHITNDLPEIPESMTKSKLGFVNKLSSMAVNTIEKSHTQTVKVSGICIDENKTPLGNVELELIPDPLIIVKAASAKTVSSSDGSFTLDVPVNRFESALNYQIIARKKSYSSNISSSFKLRDDSTSHEIVLLSTPAVVKGQIHDESGQPVPNATVSIRRNAIKGFMSSTTDEQGRFEISDIVASNTEIPGVILTTDPPMPSPARTAPPFDPTINRYSVNVQKRDEIFITHAAFADSHYAFEAPFVPGENPEANITLPFPGKIRGRVIDQTTNLPIVHAAVNAQATGHIQTFTTKTNEEGDYEVHVPEDYYTITYHYQNLVAPGLKFVPVTKNQTVSIPETYMTRPAVVYGKLVDRETGAPFEMAQDRSYLVKARGPANPLNPFSPTRVKSDGKYEVPVAPGMNMLILSTRGRSATKLFEIEADERKEVDLTVGSVEDLYGTMFDREEKFVDRVRRITREEGISPLNVPLPEELKQPTH